MIETGSKFFFAPQDDIESQILNIAKTETKELCMGMYGFHLPPLRDQFLANHKSGLPQLILLDLSQERGTAEHPDVVELITAGLDVTIGTSPLHQILHSKYLLAQSEQVVGTGSYNFSVSAAKQDNTFQIFTGLDVWQHFRAHFENARQWCISNEPQDQIKNAIVKGLSLESLGIKMPERFEE